MTQVPHITQKHYEAAWASKFAPKMSAVDICNKAIEIALAEQEELENAANESINQLVDQDMQDQFITAEEAARLGSSNVEVLLSTGEWYVIHGYYLYPSWNKYRAIRKEMPAEPHAELRALYAQQVKDGTLGNFDWEFKNGMVEWLSIKTDLGIFYASNEYRCTPKPTCQVRSLDTGELKAMTRGAAQKLQAETKDVCDWYSPHHTKPFDVDGFISEFIQEGIYTYCSKAKKPVSWKDVPVGVMTNKGELRGVYLAGDNTYRICTESKHRDGDTNWSRYVASFVELAPADQQPWIARHGTNPVDIFAIKGIVVKSKYVDGDLFVFKVIGIADGWELK